MGDEILKLDIESDQHFKRENILFTFEKDNTQ